MIKTNLQELIGNTLIRSIFIFASVLIVLSLVLSWIINESVLRPSLLAQTETVETEIVDNQAQVESDQAISQEGFTLDPAEINLDLSTQQPVTVNSILENKFDFKIEFQVETEIDQELINLVEIDSPEIISIEPNSSDELEIQVVPIAIEDYTGMVKIKLTQISGDNILSNKDLNLNINLVSTINSDTNIHKLEFTIVLAIIISSILGLIITGIWHYRSSK
jgi:hypothetical protein